MPDTIIDTPTSPPAPPVIPAGLGTKLGLLGTTVLAIVAALGPLLDGFGSGDSKTFATLATVVGVATIIGRMLQASAALLTSGSAQAFVDRSWKDESGQIDLVGLLVLILVVVLVVVLVRALL